MGMHATHRVFLRRLAGVLAPLWLLALYFHATRERPGFVRAWFNAWDVRTLYAVIGLGFHAALLVTMNVGPFPIISLAYYTCLWRGEEWRAMLRRSPRPVSGAGAARTR